MQNLGECLRFLKKLSKFKKINFPTPWKIPGNKSFSDVFKENNGSSLISLYFYKMKFGDNPTNNYMLILSPN